MRFQNERHLNSRLLVVLAVIAASALSGLTIESSSAAPFAARASVTPQIQYLGDSTGTTFTFTIENTGTEDSIGAVEIGRPGKTWTITACPSAPAGWTDQRSDTMCRYRSDAGTADDIPPGGMSSAFQVTATAPAGSQNLTGTWSVKVSRSSTFDKPSKLVAAASMSPGLGITAYSFQVLDAVVTSSAATPGAACPAASKSAITGSTGHTIVVCGRNRTTGTLTPNAANSSLAGTFVASHGSFSSGPVAPSATSRVLGSWANVTITSTAGPNKTVIAKIGSASNRTSPLTTLTGYEALNNPPEADDDSATVNEDSSGTTVDVLANDSDPDGDLLTVSAVDTTGTSGSVTITNGGADVSYDPNGQFDHLAVGESATDTFTYTASDSFGASDTATVAVTVTGVNDPPEAVDDSEDVSENSSGATVDVLGNDTDPDTGETLLVTAVDTTGTTGVVTNNGTNVTYDPNGQFENLAPDVAATDTFTYTVSDGNGGTDVATVTITVNGDDDDPVAVDDSATVAEDASATAIDVLANDTDVDGGTKTIHSITQPANGTVVVTGGGTGLTYAPNANYCNSPPGTTPDTFTYTLNGGSTATVSVAVTCADDAPTAVDDSTTIAEDAIATAIDVLINDTDVDGGTIGIDSVTQPANGNVVVTGGGTGLTYAPEVNYCNSPPGTTPDTFTYTLNGGSTATVSVTVTCVQDAPVAVDDSTTVAEDSSATAIDVLANDTDVDAGPMTIDSITQPDNGTVAVTGGGTGLTYAPDVNYCNSPPGTTPDTFTYTLNGGSTATVSVAVTCVDDLPVAVDDSSTVTLNASASAVDVLANDTDVDGGPMSIDSITQPDNGTVVITGGGTGLTYAPDAAYCNDPPGTAPDTFTYTLNGGSSATVSMTVTCDVPPVAVDDSATVAEDSAPSAVTVLANDTDPDGGPKSIASVTQPDNGTVAITGGGAGLTYVPAVNYCNDPPGTTPDTFTYTLNGGSTATVSMTVICVDDAPMAINDSATVAEDSAANPVTVLDNDTDVDGGPKSIASVTQPANGTAAVTGGGTGVSYTPNPDYCSATADTFTYTLNGGSTATVSVTVTCLNDAPVVDTSAGSLAYSENDPATPIDPGVTVSDPDAGSMITGATVAITVNFVAGQDVLALGGVHPGITAGPQVGNTLTLSGTATPAAYQAALRAVTYANTSEGPSTLTRTVTFAVTDSDALDGSDTRGITVSGVNDPPTAVNETGTTDEDTPLNVTAPGVLANDTDVDPGDTKTVDRLNGSATLTGSSAEGGAVTINANGSYTYTPPAAFQSLSTGQSDTDSFTYRMSDSAGASSTATVNLTVNGVSDAPTAVADSFDAIGNTGLFVGTTKPAAQAGREITGSVLTNDTDPDTAHASLVAEPVTNAPTTLGGTITIEADGNFTYHPDDADTSVTDTFTYRVCDSSPCNSGTVANSTGTLSLPVAGQVWYVANNQAAGGDGTSDTPFDTLVEAETASGAGDTVYVFDGDNTTTNLNTGYVMEASERLIGESRPLSLDPDGGGPLGTSSLHPGTSGAQPMLTASNEDVIVLASTTLVNGVDIDPSGSGGGISGGAGTADVTVQNVNVTDTGTAGTQPGIELDGTTGVNRFTGVTVTNGGSATAIGVRISNAGSVLFASTATNTIATSGAKALDASSTNLLNSRWNDITVTGSGTGAIRLSSTTGSPVLGDGAGTDLALQTTSGATAALDIASSNSVTVDSGGTDTISATGGAAADIRNSNGSQFFFDTVSSTNSAGDGINLDTNLVTPFDAIGGAISGAAGIAVDVNGGGVGGAVSYGGAINDGAGQTAEITGRNGGTVTLSGNIGDGGDAGGGITVSGNSGGAATFSGASKVLNTGAAKAVQFSNSDGHTLTISGGGLDVDTTSGTGVEATTAGTLNITGAGNTIDTGAGRALTVSDTDVGASPLAFQRISSNGAGGILLSNTGANNALTVASSGSGTCTAADQTGCTGGVIQNSVGADNGGALPTGTGVVLSNTRGVSLTRMHIRNHSNYGVRGTSVVGFTMADSVISGVNGTSALTAHKDGSVRFEELTGTVSMTNVAISGGYYTNLMVDNTTGVLNGTFDNVDSGAIDATGGDDAVQFEGIGNSTMNVDYKNSAITTASGDLFQYIGDGTGGGNLDLTGNAFSNNEPSVATGGGGVALVAGAKGAATMDVLNNTFRDAKTNALTIIKSRDNLAGTNNLVANITGNSIGLAGTANSGSLEGDGMEITTGGDGNATFNVTNNNIRQYNSSAIQFVAGLGVADTGQFNLNISGNSAGNPGTNGLITLLQGIRVDSGVDPADTFSTCVKFGPNSITGSSDAANKDFRLVASQGTTIRQPGYAGGNTDGTAFANYAASLIGGGAQGTAVANAPATFSGAGGTCP